MSKRMSEIVGKDVRSIRSISSNWIAHNLSICWHRVDNSDWDAKEISHQQSLVWSAVSKSNVVNDMMKLSIWQRHMSM